MIKDSELARARCPACHKMIIVRLDWRLRAHPARSHTRRWCPGSQTIADSSPLAAIVLLEVATVLREAR